MKFYEWKFLNENFLNKTFQMKSFWIKIFKWNFVNDIFKCSLLNKIFKWNFLTYNGLKSVVAEKFIRTLKNNF